MSSSATATKFIDNDRVIVTEWRFRARGQHRLAPTYP